MNLGDEELGLNQVCNSFLSPQIKQTNNQNPPFKCFLFTLRLLSSPVHILFSSTVPFRFMILFLLQKGLHDPKLVLRLMLAGSCHYFPPTHHKLGGHSSEPLARSCWGTLSSDWLQPTPTHGCPKIPTAKLKSVH